MRKIEQWMIQAIETHRDQIGKVFFDSLESTKCNTRVTTNYRSDGQYVSTVYLHGNMIAQLSNGEWGFKLAGWNTHTTKSRINTIATYWKRPGVNQSKGNLFSGEKEINKYDWF